jgi:hypothetical protein
LCHRHVKVRDSAMIVISLFLCIDVISDETQRRSSILSHRSSSFESNNDVDGTSMSTGNDIDDDIMPIVVNVEEEQPIPDVSIPSDMDSEFIIVTSNDTNDEKIRFDNEPSSTDTDIDYSLTEHQCRRKRRRSCSLTSNSNKKQCSSFTFKTITNEHIEQCLRTLSNETAHTRTRSVKAPARFIDHFLLTDTDINDEQHRSCSYNVTPSNETNILGFTLKSVPSS